MLARLKREDYEENYSDQSHEQINEKHKEIEKDTQYPNTLQLYESILYSQLIQEIKSFYHVNI